MCIQKHSETDCVPLFAPQTDSRNRSRRIFPDHVCLQTGLERAKEGEIDQIVRNETSPVSAGVSRLIASQARGQRAWERELELYPHLRKYEGTNPSLSGPASIHSEGRNRSPSRPASGKMHETKDRLASNQAANGSHSRGTPPLIHELSAQESKRYFTSKLSQSRPASAQSSRSVSHNQESNSFASVQTRNRNMLQRQHQHRRSTSAQSNRPAPKFELPRSATALGESKTELSFLGDRREPVTAEHAKIPESSAMRRDSGPEAGMPIVFLQSLQRDDGSSLRRADILLRPQALGGPRLKILKAGWC